MDKAVEELKLNVVDECSYQFKKDNAPRCYNYLFDIRKSFVYSYICRWRKNNIGFIFLFLGVESEKIKSIIKDDFEVNVLNIDACYFTRGN